jgi:branched-chain amino acid transport system substrate-binding protein
MKYRSLLSLICLGVCIVVWSVVAQAEKPIVIGAPMPLTGPFASSGEQMKMALDLGVQELNAAGGLFGRQLKIIYGDVANVTVEEVKSVGERILGAGVDLVITGYDSPGRVNVKVYGQSDVPYLHGNAKSDCTQAVAETPDKYWNVFQYTYSEKEYGIDAISHLFNIPEQIGWTPPNKNVAIVTADYPYNAIPAAEFANIAKRIGYEVVVYETTPFGVVEYGPILSKIEATKPSFITYWDPVPADAARFMNQFVDYFGSQGIDSLLYMQYTPSMPEFLELTGKNADGLIWVGGVVEAGAPYEEYKKKWVAKYKKDPIGLYAVITRDAFDIWVQAVKRAGCVNCYKEVSRQIRESPYVGVGATFVFRPDDQAAIAGEYLLPLGWNQIWDARHVVVTPKRFAKGAFRKPPWIK